MLQNRYKLLKSAKIAVRDCLGVRSGEKVVIVTDKLCREIGYALWDIAKNITESILIEIAPGKIHGQEPPALVAEILKKCDVFIIPTSHSLTHTRARIEANRAGARGATMPGITPEVMMRTLSADYKKISIITHMVAKALSRAEKAYIKTEQGTNLELSLESRRGYADTGIIKKPKEFSNLPAGEAYIAPIENRTNGIVFVDGSFAPIGLLNGPVRLEIESGEIKRVIGNKKLAAIFKKFGLKERVLCELGIGTNYQAKITGNVLEDEKVLGSVHIAFGNNLGFGGRNKARIHLDGVIKKPRVWLDNRLIIEKGRLLI